MSGYFHINFIYIILLLYTTGANAQKPGDNVLSLYVDKYNHQWIGTDKGLLIKSGNQWKAYNTRQDYPGIINDIEPQDEEASVLWIGTTDGIIKVTYSANDITSSVFFNSSNTTFKSDNIKSIAFDNKSAGYFTTFGGIGVLTNAVWRFYTRLFDVSRNEFTSAKSKGDTVYFGTRGEGVARIFRYADGYTGASTYVTPWSALPGDSITCIYFDSKGNQWYGTTNGISRHSSIEAKEGWDFSLTDQLPNRHVTVIAGDIHCNIWIGTMGGLARIDAELNTVKAWSVSDGLPSDVINYIFIDKNQSVWIGTNLGVSYFDGLAFSNIRTSDHAKDFINF